MVGPLKGNQDHAVALELQDTRFELGPAQSGFDVSRRSRVRRAPWALKQAIHISRTTMASLRASQSGTSLAGSEPARMPTGSSLMASFAFPKSRLSELLRRRAESGGRFLQLDDGTNLAYARLSPQLMDAFKVTWEGGSPSGRSVGSWTDGQNSWRPPFERL
jgi:hypothetical protein